jgi:hypothetical protein
MISLDEGAKDHLGDDLVQVGEAAHRVLRKAKAAGVWVTGGGFSIVEVDDLDQTMAWASRFATACQCAQEIRLIMGDPEV